MARFTWFGDMPTSEAKEKCLIPFSYFLSFLFRVRVYKLYHICKLTFLKPEEKTSYKYDLTRKPNLGRREEKWENNEESTLSPRT